jgi:hypothetical protein
VDRDKAIGNLQSACERVDIRAVKSGGFADAQSGPGHDEDQGPPARIDRIGETFQLRRRQVAHLCWADPRETHSARRANRQQAHLDGGIQ